jgi:hypothetical protein
LEEGQDLVDCNIQNESTLHPLNGMVDHWSCFIPEQLDDVEALVDYILLGPGEVAGTFLSSKQNFVNTLIAFLRIVHSFLSRTLDEHWRIALIIYMLPNI